MENIKTLITHAQNKEFTQFKDSVKDIISTKISEHPRMVSHNDTVQKFEKQTNIYSQIEDVAFGDEKED